MVWASHGQQKEFRETDPYRWCSGWTGGLWIGKKGFCGGEPLLQGVLAFLGGFVVVNGGEVVVNCVVNVVL